MYVTTIHRLKYIGQESKTSNLQFNFSDTSVALTQSQGHQTYNDNVEPKQAHYHTEFERSWS